MKVRLFVVLALVVSFVAVVGPSTPPAEACPLPVRTPIGVKLANCHQGTGNGSGSGSGSGGGGPICWVVWRGDSDTEALLRQSYDEGTSEIPGTDVPEEVTWWWNRCLPAGCLIGGGEPPICMVAEDWGGSTSPFNFYFTEPLDLVNGDPWEILLLETLWARVEESFEDPELELWPPADDPAIVNIPTFVSLENPPEAFETGEECSPPPPPPIGGSPVCVEMQGEPTLWFDPGDGSGAVECSPDAPGFDPEDARGPDEQADGACTHVYRQHTGEAYPGQVQIEWTVTWSSTNADGTAIDGVFDPIFLPDGEPNAPRVVEEVQTLVTKIESGEPEG